MTRRRSAALIVRDIAHNVADLRWTAENPEVRGLLPDAGPWYAVMDFEIVEATFRDTGPVTVELFLNGTLAARERYVSPGKKRLSAPAPAEALRTPGENMLKASIRPVWVAPNDGAKLGVLLQGMGFLRR
jgi:hypothetical protein